MEGSGCGLLLGKIPENPGRDLIPVPLECEGVLNPWIKSLINFTLKSQVEAPNWVHVNKDAHYSSLY